MSSLQDNESIPFHCLGQLAPYINKALIEYCDLLVAIDLKTGGYDIIFYHQNKYKSLPSSGNWTTLYMDLIYTYVAPARRSSVLKVFNYESLCQNYTDHKMRSGIQFPIFVNQYEMGYIDAQIHFIYDADHPIAIMCSKDITLTSDNQHDQHITQQYDAALRNIYDELYELNLSQNTYQIIYHVDDKYITPPDTGNLLEIIPLIASTMIHPDDQSRFLKFTDLDNIGKEFKSGRNHIIGEFRKRCIDGSYRWASLTLFPFHEWNGADEICLCCIMDISDQKRMEFDSLTGICTEQSFYMHTERLLLENPAQQYALIRLNINRFKFINEIYGLAEGDQLLRYVAEIIHELSTAAGICGRMNSDIFCLTLPYESEDELIKIIQQISLKLERYHMNYKPRCSFGICTIDDPNVPINILCDRANLALQTVKGNLLRSWAFYDFSLRAKQFDERQIESEMENALDQGQFCIYLQPKHSLTNGEIIGAEALVRWNHPREGFLAPARFIPLFERNGFIVHLDTYTWELTFQTIRRWLDAGYKPVPVSVNVSRMHIYTPDFTDKILHLIHKYNIPGNLIELELTESAFVEHTEELYSNMATLKDYGIIFSMDDFGSGYSSLNMLKEAPVNTIKLDREFLNESSATQKGQIIVENTVHMIQKLNLNVIAEGVENLSQVEFLLRSGCLSAQGFYFSKPMCISDFEELTFQTEKDAPSSSAESEAGSTIQS